MLVLGLLEVALARASRANGDLSGYYFDPLLLTYPAHHEWWTASGWDLRNARRMKSNNFGFATSREFSRNESAVALIGDSFVEASALTENDGPGPNWRPPRRSAGIHHGRPGIEPSRLRRADPVRRGTIWSARLRPCPRAWRCAAVAVRKRQRQRGMPGPGDIPASYREAGAADFLEVVLRESRAAQYLLGQLRLDPQRLLNAVLASMRSARRREAG